MEANFKLCKNQHCQLEVIGLELKDEEYYNLYLNFCTINVLYKVDSEENEILIDTDINEHKVSQYTDEYDPDISRFDLQGDGLYKVVHVILPLTTQSVEDLQLLNYFTDGTNFYRYDNQLKQVPLEEILEINPEGTNIIKDDVYTFSICNLNTCFYNVCKKLLHEYCSSGCPTNNNLNVQTRDLVWMALNTIKYLVEKGAFFEAQRMLETITGCNGLCENITNTKSNEGCGCS